MCVYIYIIIYKCIYDIVYLSPFFWAIHRNNKTVQNLRCELKTSVKGKLLEAFFPIFSPRPTKGFNDQHLGRGFGEFFGIFSTWMSQEVVVKG